MIGYIPKREDGQIRRINAWTRRLEWPVPEGIWTTGGGIELLWYSMD